MFDHLLRLDATILISLGAVLGYIGGKLIEILIGNYRDKRQEYRSEYAKFASIFTPYLQQLEMGPATLNMLIVGEFSQHDLARRDFIRHLGWFRRRPFNRKWLEYLQKYYEVKQLGPMAMAVAIAPPEIDLQKYRPTPEDMIRWESDRRRELHRIITDLLRIARP